LGRFLWSRHAATAETPPAVFDKKAQARMRAAPRCNRLRQASMNAAWAPRRRPEPNTCSLGTRREALPVEAPPEARSASDCPGAMLCQSIPALPVVPPQHGRSDVSSVPFRTRSSPAYPRPPKGDRAPTPPNSACWQETWFDLLPQAPPRERSSTLNTTKPATPSPALSPTAVRASRSHWGRPRFLERARGPIRTLTSADGATHFSGPPLPIRAPPETLSFSFLTMPAPNRAILHGRRRVYRATSASGSRSSFSKPAPSASGHPYSFLS